MESTRETYKKRVEEIDFFFAAFRQLDAEVANPFSGSDTSTEKYKLDNFLKILKANALLMIYNIIESTVINGIQEIYDKIKETGATYSTVRKEIQDIWFSYKFRQVYDPKAHFKSYMDKALELVNSIMAGETIELNRDALNISGNLDANEIRKVCSDHKIEFKPDIICKGGERLIEVKHRRNQLAHGDLSFSGGIGRNQGSGLHFFGRLARWNGEVLQQRGIFWLENITSNLYHEPQRTMSQ
jgi:hypothetical protein